MQIFVIHVTAKRSVSKILKECFKIYTKIQSLKRWAEDIPKIRTLNW